MSFADSSDENLLIQLREKKGSATAQTSTAPHIDHAPVNIGEVIFAANRNPFHFGLLYFSPSVMAALLKTIRYYIRFETCNYSVRDRSILYHYFEVLS
jgi:hypothetical protein